VNLDLFFIGFHFLFVTFNEISQLVPDFYQIKKKEGPYWKGSINGQFTMWSLFIGRAMFMSISPDFSLVVKSWFVNKETKENLRKFLDYYDANFQNL